MECSRFVIGSGTRRRALAVPAKVAGEGQQHGGAGRHWVGSVGEDRADFRKFGAMKRPSLLLRTTKGHARPGLNVFTPVVPRVGIRGVISPP